MVCSDDICFYHTGGHDEHHHGVKLFQTITACVRYAQFSTEELRFRSYSKRVKVNSPKVEVDTGSQLVTVNSPNLEPTQAHIHRPSFSSSSHKAVTFTVNSEPARFQSPMTPGEQPMQTFIVHEEFLHAVSPYLSFLVADLPQANNGVIELGNKVKATVFAAFVEWVYSRHVLTATDDGPRAITEDSDYTFLTELFIFATTYDVPNLRDDVMTKFWHRHRYGQGTIRQTVVLRAFSKLSESSALCRFLVDVWVARATPGEIEAIEFSPMTARAANRFMRSAWAESVRLVTGEGRRDPADGSPTAYHGSGTGITLALDAGVQP